MFYFCEFTGLFVLILIFPYLKQNFFRMHNDMQSMVIFFLDWFSYMIRVSFQTSGTTFESCQK